MVLARAWSSLPMMLKLLVVELCPVCWICIWMERIVWGAPCISHQESLMFPLCTPHCRQYPHIGNYIRPHSSCPWGPGPLVSLVLAWWLHCPWNMFVCHTYHRCFWNFQLCLVYRGWPHILCWAFALWGCLFCACTWILGVLWSVGAVHALMWLIHACTGVGIIL